MNFHDKDLRVLTNLTHALHKFSDVEEIYRVALDSVMELEGVDMTAIYLVDEEKREAVIQAYRVRQAYRNVTADYVRRAGRIPYPKGVTWKVINSGTILNVKDIQKDLDIGPAGSDIGPHGCLGIPIFLEEKVIGVIWFASYKERKFNERQVTLFSTLGDQIAIAIAKAKREETLRASLTQLSKKSRYETIISTVTRSVHRSINLGEVLENAVDAMSKNIGGVDNVSIYMVEGQEAVIRAYRGYPEWFIERVGRIPYPRGFTWKTIIEGKPRYCPDVDQDTVIGPAGRELRTKSYASMPIHYEGKTVGALNINSFKKNAFDEEELKLLEIVAQQIQIAINNARQAEALRQSEERYRDLVENSLDLICTHDLEGNILSANRALVRQSGYEQAEEFLGHKISDFLAPEVRRSFDSYIDTLVKEGHAHGLMKILTRSGEERILEYHNSLRTEGLDKPIVRGMARDVTERIRAEKALKESNQFNKAIISSASEGILVYDRALRYVMWNRFMEELTGLPAEHVLGKYALDLFPHLHEQGVYSLLQMALKGETVSSPDIPYYVPQTGKSGWVSGSYGPHSNADGEIIGVIGLVRDITERKRTDEALKESFVQLSKKNRYETIISAVTRSVHRSINLQDVLENAVEAVKQNITSNDYVGIYLVEGEEAVLKAHRGFPDQYLDRAGRIPYPKGFTWKTIIEGKPAYCADIDEDTAIGPAGREIGTKSYASMPINSKGKTVGVININSLAKYAFDEDELKLLEIVAQQIEIAINNARQAEALKRSEETLKESLTQLTKKNHYETIISTVTRSVHKSINLQEVLENAVDVMSRNIDGAENVSIYLVEGKEAVMKAYRGYPDWFIKRVGRIPYPKDFTWKTIMEEKPRYCADIDKDTIVGRVGREIGVKSYLSMPIRYEGKTVGCININSLKKNAFSEEELKLLEIVAQQIETAFNNARQAEALRKARDELEMRVRERTAKLIEVNEALQTEISDRKRAEEELRESEGRLQAVLDSSTTVIYIKDTESRYITVNRQYETLFHVKREELKGKTDYDIFPKNLADAFRANDQKVIMAKAPLEFEEIAPHDGGLHTYISIKFPLYDSAGTPYAICGISTDITERKRAEEELSAAQRRLAFLAEASSILSGSLDYETTLKNVARLAVPEMADWGAVDIIDEGGSLKRLAVAHIDPAKVDLAYKVESRYPTYMDAPYGMLNVLPTSKPELYPEIPESVLVEVARDAEHLQILRDLGLKSAISVPLLTRGQMLGVITFVIAESGRRYNSDDLALAEDLARRAASAIDNARLYRSAQRAEERFSSFMQNLPAAAWIKDIEGRYIYANRIGEEIFHKKLSDLIGKTDEEISPTDTAKQFKESDRLVITRGESLQTIETLPQEDGIHHSIVSKFPIFDHNGTLVMVGGVAIDITERMKAEEALRESEERYRTFVEHTYDLIIEVSIDGRFLDVSSNFKDVLGYEPAELVGRSIFEHIHPDDRLAVMEEFQRAGKTLSSGHAVYRYRHKDGQWLWIESTGKPFQAAPGEIRGLIASRDITERKRMEEELLKTQRLESIGVLAGGIAHDFNNLLTSILGNVSLIKMYSNPEDKMYKRLAEAEKACLRAKDLTQQLLTFSKGGAPIKKLTSIKELVRDSASFAVRGSDVRCEFRIEDGLWNVEVDEGQIAQVINNLVINAQQAMPQGGVIKIKAQNIIRGEEDRLALKDGRYIKITVEDEGIGIAKEHLSKIFDPYFTTKQMGSGLGLTTAYSIIKSHDGYIEVESELGVGTKFYVYLPATQEGVSEKREQERVIGGKGRILVMDDEEMIREVAEEIIKHLGYEVEFARNGREAIELYREAKGSSKPFNVVIMDLTVPGGMGGREAIKRLLKIDPEIKAIVSSGYSNDPVMSEYRKYGFSGVVAKPYKIQELSEVLNRIIRVTAQEAV